MVLPSKGKLAKMPVVLKKAILVLLGNRSISIQLKLFNALDSVD